MISSISIENFKGISESVTIPLRPITLLFGKNSAGKSTILQAMHYTREILQHRNPSPDRTAVGGDTIDLGGFENLVHDHDLTRTISLQFEVTLDGAGLVPFPSARTFTEHAYGLDEDADRLSAVQSVIIGLKTAWHQDQAVISGYDIWIDDHHLVGLEMVGQSACVTAFNEEHPIFARSEEDDESTEDLSVAAADAWLSMADSSGWVQLDGVTSCVPDLDGLLPMFESVAELVVDEAGDPEPDDGSALLVWVFLSRVLVRSGQALLRELSGMRYVGPIRTVPPRGNRSPLTPDESRWSSGYGAWDAMLRSSELTERTSEYLQERLALGYSITRENCVRLDVDGTTMAELRMLATRYEEYDAAYFLRNVLEPIEELARHPSLQLRDAATGVHVDPVDVGVGVSQVVPVVVGAIATTAEAGRCSIFAVEQPELHVHPAIQVALGDVFIDGIRTTDRLMLIETHSEHLLLRLLRRVRESEGSESQLSPDELSVIYVMTDENGMRMTPLEVTDDGDFNAPWPEGFFEERAEELF